MGEVTGEGRRDGGRSLGRGVEMGGSRGGGGMHVFVLMFSLTLRLHVFRNPL